MGCGGAEIMLGSISRSLVKKGHQVHLLYFKPFHPTWENYPDRENFLKEVPITNVGGNIQFRFLRAPIIENKGFVNFVNNFKPDIIHSHLFLAELFCRSALFEDVVYFSHGHDNMIQLKKFGLKTFLKKESITNYWERSWLIKKYKTCNNHFIAISKDVQQYLNENLEGFSSRINYLPNAINTEIFFTNRNYRSIPGKPFHMVSIANLVQKKNHVFLIDVMKYLFDKGYDVTMDVLGAGPLMEMLTNKTKEMNLQDRLFFRGSVGNIPQRLWDADLYVHPAKYEPFGLVLLEAMASGLPVVSLDGFGNRELIIEGENGFMLDANCSAQDFAEKIILFIKNRELLQRMGTFACAFSKNYDMDHYTDQLLKLYQQALDEKATIS